MTDIDVLIVGSGPTGLTLGLELAMHKIPFRIIDKAAASSPKSRAFVLQPRTQELLSRYGDAAKAFLGRGVTGVGFTFYVKGRKTADLDMTDLGYVDTAFPLPILISQAETEGFLEGLLGEWGHHVERSVAATKIEQDGDGVTATVTLADGTESAIRSRYVVGFDGAHSVVRHEAGLEFPGEPYRQDFMLADLRMEWDGPRDRMLAFLGRGILLLFPLDGGVTRLVAALAPSRPGASPSGKDVDTSTAADAKDPTLADFERLWAEFGAGPATLSHPIWLARFRLHHRSVERYRAARVFVAGDAAHIHSPAGGQGMNTGIQDAINLGWKLARVLRGTATRHGGALLLDSYHDERWPVGQRLLRGTDRIFTWATSTNWVYTWVRNALVSWVVPWLAASAARRARGYRFMSELAIRYRRSPIVRTAPGFVGPVRGGDRAVDGQVRAYQRKEVEEGNGAGAWEDKWMLEFCRGPGYHLLLFSGVGSERIAVPALRDAGRRFAAADREGAAVVVVLGGDAAPEDLDEIDEAALLADGDGQLHGRYGFLEPGLVLIRPDGYVEYIGPLDAMDNLLAWASAG